MHCVKKEKVAVMGSALSGSRKASKTGCLVFLIDKEGKQLQAENVQRDEIVWPFQENDRLGCLLNIAGDTVKTQVNREIG